MIVPPPRAAALPFVFAAALLACVTLDRVRHTPGLVWAFAGAATILMAWLAALLVRGARRQRALTLSISLRRQHYVQLFAHIAIFSYWGWYWRPVYEAVPLVIAQLLFAYAFDMLLTWWRRDHYVLGFGPFPIVFSTNLFLWFRPEWFAWQFVMVAVAFGAKALIQWERDGRRTHVFNPSAFALTVISAALLATGMSDVTVGQDIAITQFYPPHMYAFLVGVSLPGQMFFGVASMTVAAVVTTYLWGLAYLAATGTYFFVDSYVPIAVFLGMHLLVTDPSTSPRSELGRLLFGALYGLTVVGLYALLTAAGLPAFYDKLLQVPLMNLVVPSIDRLARSPALNRLAPERFGPAPGSPRRHAAYAGIWASVFLAISVAGGLGDEHRGQWLPFWQRACAQGREGACGQAELLETMLCRAGSGWACNELGIRRATRSGQALAALASWQQACERGFEPGCANARDGGARTAPPPPADYPILLRGSKGPLPAAPEAALRARACELEWPAVCGHPRRD